MKRVGVREFRDHAPRYLGGDQVIAVERRGEPIGLYVPTKLNRDRADADAMARLGATVERLLAATGMSEHELSEFFDLTKPVPEGSRQEPAGASVGSTPTRR